MADRDNTALQDPHKPGGRLDSSHGESEHPKRKQPCSSKQLRTKELEESPAKSHTSIIPGLDSNLQKANLSVLQSRVDGNSTFRHKENFFGSSSSGVIKIPNASDKSISPTGEDLQREETSKGHVALADRVEAERSNLPVPETGPSDPPEIPTEKAPYLEALGNSSSDARKIIPVDSVDTTTTKSPKKKGCSGKKKTLIARIRTAILDPQNARNTTASANRTCSASRNANSTQAAHVPDLSESSTRGLSTGALAGISIVLIFLASIPITIAIVRYYRRRRRKLQVTFEKAEKGNPVRIDYPEVPDGKDGEISPAEIEELMNRIALVQNVQGAFRSKKFSRT